MTIIVENFQFPMKTVTSWKSECWFLLCWSTERRKLMFSVFDPWAQGLFELDWRNLVLSNKHDRKDKNMTDVFAIWTQYVEISRKNFIIRECLFHLIILDRVTTFLSSWNFIEWVHFTWCLYKFSLRGFWIIKVSLPCGE